MTKPVLFWWPQTRAGRSVWLFEELGIEYESEQIDIYDHASARNAKFSTSDSAAIAVYAADRYRDIVQLAPAWDAPQRGKYLYWMCFQPGMLEPAFAEARLGLEPNRLSNGWGDFDSVFQGMVSALDGREWLLDTGFSAADVMLGSSIVFLQDVSALPENDALIGYGDRCRARRAHRAAQAIEAAAAQDH